MSHQRWLGNMRRMFAGFLAAGLIVTGMPSLSVNAANEILEEPISEKPDTEAEIPENKQESPDTEAEIPENKQEKPENSGGQPGDGQPGSEENKPEEELPGIGEGRPGDEQPGETRPGDEVPSDNEPGAGEEQEPPVSEEDTPPAEETPDTSVSENELYAALASSVSENSVSENNLIFDDEEDDWPILVGGYHELPEERDVSVVDESAGIYDYDDEIAPLMSGSLPAQYIPANADLPLTRDQSPYGSCWAHSAMALAEIDMMNHGGVSREDADYSELHLAYFSYNGAVDDLLGGLDGDSNTGIYETGAENFLQRGGNLALAQHVLANWVGAADENTASYREAETALESGLSKDIAFTDAVHLQNSFRVNMKENRDTAKRMIQTYGGLGVSYYHPENKANYYNEEHKCFYLDVNPGTTNHAVTIVGWDDGFSKTNFSKTPEGDGAWLIRNSWEEKKDADSRSYNTYFWMSYYDKSLSEAGYAFDFESADNYHHNYQYDGGMSSDGAPGMGGTSPDYKLRIANVFKVGGNKNSGYENGERLEAVGVDFAKAQTPYKVLIYKNLTDPTNPESGTLMEASTVSGTCGCEGFYTISLSEPVTLAADDTFAVVVEIGATTEKEGYHYAWYSCEGSVSGSFFKCTTSAKEGQSFVKSGGTWTDYGKKNNANLRIKAYTMDNDGGAGLPTKIALKNELQDGSKIEVGKGDTYQVSWEVLPRYAKDRTVRFESDQPSIATVNEKGLITGVSDGTATITITCNADESVTASFTAEVYSDLRSIKITGESGVTAGETLTLQTICSPSSVSAADLQWESADERVLTVDGDGIVTGVAPGYATVTAGIGRVTASKELMCKFPGFVWKDGYSRELKINSSIEGAVIQWPAGPNVKTYRLYRYDSASSADRKLLTEIAAENGKDAYSYLDKNVEGGKQYRYLVEATVSYLKGSEEEEKTESTRYRYPYTMPSYYSITYHLNGGENESSNPTYYQAGYPTYIRNPLPRAGYTFTGWFYDEDLTQKLEDRYLSSDTTGPVDLYAGWTPIVYSINYSTGGGSNAPDNITSYTIEDESFTLLAPTRTGYRFQGWFMDSAFNKPISKIEKGVTYGNLYLYAKWEKIPEGERKITYELNGGVNAAENPETYISTDGYVPLKDPTKKGYDFQGWYQENTYKNRVYGLSVSLMKDDLTLYAKWEIATYTITYQDGGGTHSNPKSYTINDPNFLLQNAIRSGYQFAGWYADRAFTKPISEIKTDTCANLFIYAKWEQIYKITYQLDGGVNDPANPAVYVESDVITLRNPTKKDCHFAGWYTDRAFKKPISELNGRSGDLTLYAKWTEIPRTITYELNGGTAEKDLNPVTYIPEDGSIRLKAPKRDGYDFQGWYRENTYVNKIEYLNSGSVTGDLTLFAKWEIHTYAIIYVLNGGTNAAENPETYTVESAVILLQDAVRTDSIFEGWYSDPKYRQKVTQIDPADMCDITLYAKWQGEEAPDITDIRITPPTRTTYKQGDEIDLTGGRLTCVTGASGYALPITAGMISGFDASVPGICSVNVTYEGFQKTFDTLIVAAPWVEVSTEQKLSQIPLPVNAHGAYAWIDGDISFAQEGTYTAAVSFVPTDSEKFQTLTDLLATVTVSRQSGMSIANGEMTLSKESFCYTGKEQRPSLTIKLGDKLLAEDVDYTLSYANNKNVGMATAIAEGIGNYYGSLSQSFSITPAALQIKAKDMKLLIGSSRPQQSDFEYEITGLLADDRLIKEPEFFCEVTDSQLGKPGKFPIVPSNADAGPNYAIAYENGLLRIVSEYVVYRVSFDVQGHGKAPEGYDDVKAGSTIVAPAAPVAEGYVFEGWCRDAACTKDWDFDTDIVESDITLYARWLKKSAQADSAFQMQEIEDIYYYTGNAWKPAVKVYDNNGETLLKAGRDYTVKYFNNINANAGGIWKKDSGQNDDFNAALPYIQITGKGNYTDEIKVNFDIHPAVIADENGNPAQKVVLRYTDQLVTAKRGVLKPFGSVKYIKGMKQDKDYRLTLAAVNVKDGSGSDVTSGRTFEKAWIPAGYSGEFLLTVEGIGNYEGSIQKTVQVTDKDHLMKNAKITLGKNQKKVELIGTSVQLTPAASDSADTFTVKMGNTVLEPGQDYEVSYLDHSNERVGKATLVITGINDYTGTKTAAFTVIGKAFTARTITVSGLTDQVYTGKAITQNNAVLVYNAGQSDERQLTYGTDYTVSYTKNINKGTATITFKGLAESGFSGSLKKSFKIAADDIAMVNRGKGWDKIVVGYSKAGAKPAEEIVLTNRNGVRLRNGKDYTLSYTNNNLAADSSAAKAPTITVKGKGNYQGSFTIPFTIAKADLKSKLDKGEITVKTAAMAYQAKKPDDYAYKPAVKLLEGKAALRMGTDVTITYRNNTQAEYNAYIQSLSAGDVNVPAPEAVITVPSDSSYMIGAGAEDQSIVVPLTIYRNKLTKQNLKVTFLTDSIYTGTQVKPKVSVFYLNAEGSQIPLKEGKDYTLSYGANVKSGHNAGSVTISGIGTYYGGDVTVKFAIQRKQIRY